MFLLLAPVYVAPKQPPYQIRCSPPRKVASGTMGKAGIEASQLVRRSKREGGPLILQQKVIIVQDRQQTLIFKAVCG